MEELINKINANVFRLKRSFITADYLKEYELSNDCSKGKQ
jgi:hypothetical protein